MDVATLALSAEMVGGMQLLLNASVEYAKTRKQFGKPIGQFQAVQHHCANMLLLTESTRSAVYYAAWVMGNDPERLRWLFLWPRLMRAMVIARSATWQFRCTEVVGFTWDENIHFYYKRSKASELMFGDATYHRERIAKLVIDYASEPARAASGAADSRHTMSRL